MDQLKVFTTAIKHGDAARSSEIAETLARRKANLLVQVDDSITSVSPTNQEISIDICIEDRETAGVHLTLKLAPTVTINTLKLLMFERFGFPPEVQRWVVGKRLPDGGETLSHCIIRNNETFYLYLLPARCVGLTKQKVLNLYGSSSRVDTLLLARDTSDLGQSGNCELYGSNNSNVENVQPIEISRINNDIQMQNEVEAVGWMCPACTFVNQPTRPGCELCTGPRPENFVIPAGYQLSEEERKRLEREQHLEIENERQLLAERSRNFGQLLALEDVHVVVNSDPFTCPICMDVIEPGNGVILRDCLHTFCRDCLIGQIKYSDSSVVTCPYSDDQYRCAGSLQQREIQSLVPQDLYEKHLSLSLKEAESRMRNTFHCQTPNCVGFCVYDESVNTFLCQTCSKENCLTCKAIHDGITCRQYQEELKVRAQNDVAARKTQEKIMAMLAKGDAMECPTCDIIVMKKDGCDWIMCTMCKTEICWVTKGARWGPMGEGDISGGCKCGVDAKPCHPNCQNCH